MIPTLIPNSIYRTHWERFLQEDGVFESASYLNLLPTDRCRCELKCKSSGVVAGLPFFFDLFSVEMGEELIKKWEGKDVAGNEIIVFETSFRDAILKERVALNLLTHLSSIATKTKYLLKEFQGAGNHIKLLDTRKTTPGLRFFERYAFELMGGQPHRAHQSDQWMIKDNHKQFFGGLAKALKFFEQFPRWGRPIMVEIHSETEFQEAISLGVEYVMLDNFSPTKARKLAERKPPGMTLEVSGGINSETIKEYIHPQVDAMSMGSIYTELPKMDFSLKIFPIQSRT